MFISIFYNGLFKKIVTSLNHGLNPLVEPPAGLGHGVPRVVGYDLRDLCLQAAVLWGLLLTSLSQKLQT
jgi:hypothetical protein